ncbi:MAG: ComEC/Rec2 family competence protein [Lewinellaceae bacterium]|nr:ComEC/Rec2 family competence protein [Phaeodactylibacter sp.]MCB9039717.1 ComEC/Rec2 family competence protein [Lewinellaceae bacterium]
MNWREYPMARLLLPVLLGIGIEAIGQDWLQWVALTVLVLLLALLAFWQQPGWRFSRRWWFGLALNLCFFLLGLLLAHFHDERRHPFYPAPPGRKALVVGRVKYLEPTNAKVRLAVAIQALADDEGRLQKARGRLLAYLDITAGSRQLQAGDVLLLHAELLPLPRPLNPQAFDYRRYLHYQNIHYQAFVKEGGWRRLEHRPNLASLTRKLRRACLKVLERHLPTENEHAVAAALILGYKAELSDSTRDAYAHTGAMHVLAVSGLHVGIIQLLVSFLLGLIRLPWRYWPLLRILLLLACIWAFALVTGASPSVLRAATLFSFLSVGQAMRRRTNIYNTLAASAFLLLCIDPYLLFNVGFQLSYLAVLGIVYFQPIFYRQWYIENRAGDYLWKLLAVSLAAQLSTLPLSLYYFHQFPLYFWLSGLIVVPAAALILSSGLALFALQQVPVIGIAIGKLLYGATWMVNALIFLIQQIPGGLIQGFWVGPAAVALLYLALLCAVAAREARNFKWVLGALFCLFGVATLHAIREVQVQNQRALVAYHIPRATAIALVEGKKASLICSQGLSDEQLEYACRNHHWYRRAPLLARQPLSGKGRGRSWRHRQGALQFGPYRLLAIREQRQLPPGGCVSVDIALLCGGVDIELEALQRRVDFRLVLIDGSNPPWKARKWMEQAKELGVKCHYTGEGGAWVQEW